MSNIDSIISKVNKLLALSKSSNANEAAAAAAAANRLIDQYRLSEIDLNTSEESDPLLEDDGFIYETGRIVPWKSSLAVTLAKHYGCAIFNSVSKDTGRKYSRYKLIGRKSDISLARYMFSWLALECQRLSDQEARGKGKVFASSYCQGFVAGVAKQLATSRQESLKNANESAIIKINAREQESIAFMHKMHTLRGKAAPSAARLNPLAFDAGMSRGKNIHLGGAIATGSGIKMLEG